jgi:hemerythrin-like domain-containing protein
MTNLYEHARRTFLRDAALTSGGLLLTGLVPAGHGQVPATQPGAKEGTVVSPAEDLMREHGVLSRILLIYDAAARRTEARLELPRDVIVKAADLVRRFVQDYHEKLEEKYLFPRFERAGVLVDLVAVLRLQHQAGRRVTDEILAGAKGPLGPDLVAALGAFNRMYRPHKAREDTVLFPALHTVFSSREYDALGDSFEDRERELFGPHGFEKVVADVAELEKTLGLYDLGQFTPSVRGSGGAP